MNYDGPYNHQRKVSASSAILLVVFVAAALIMVAIVVWKPLVHQAATPTTSAGEAARNNIRERAPLQEQPGFPGLHG